MDGFAVFAVYHDSQVGAGFAFADDIEGFGAVDAVGVAVFTGFEFERQHAHADEVGAVDALKPFGDNGFDTGQTHAFGRPVTRGTLTVVGTGDDDQRLFAVHIGFDGFPHAHHLAFGFHAGE